MVGAQPHIVSYPQTPVVTTIYYKANCATSLTALRLLKKNSKEAIQKIEYLVDVPSENELKKILKLLGMKASEFIRKKEPLYKEKFEGKEFSEAEYIKIMLENPILIDRPIVIKDGKAILCRPSEKVLELF
jgi:arsenate reductase (glutaredoxin)